MIILDLFDEGKFTLMATNEAGTHSASVRLVVHGKQLNSALLVDSALEELPALYKLILGVSNLLSSCRINNPFLFYCL